MSKAIAMVIVSATVLVLAGVASACNYGGEGNQKPWYAHLNGDGKLVCDRGNQTPVLGPFDTKKECENAVDDYDPEPPPIVPPVVRLAPVPQVNSDGFCVQTLQRGETFVQASLHAFEPGGDWWALEQQGATVTLDGHVVTLLWEGGKGVIRAANVPGVGLTCAQPYVSTDGVYANPAYGLR